MNGLKLFSPGALVLAVVLFALINLGASPLLRTARIDLSQEKLHTLSEGTVHILKNLEEPITLKFYWSEEAARDLPGLKNYARRIQELLEEYGIVAGSGLRLETVDPKPFSEAEDDAVRYGLQGIPLGTGETLYFGLVGLGAASPPQVIPFFQQERETFLEYDLSQMVHTLTQPQKPTVGLLSALPMGGGASPGNPFAMEAPWIIVEQLRSQFTVRDLATDIRQVPTDIDVLMVVQPQELTEAALYSIDQYVLGGGRALVFVDPLAESALTGQARDPFAGTPAAAKLLAAWGIRIEDGEVVGDLGAAQRVSIGGRFRSQVIDYLPWLGLRGDRLNRTEIVTSQLGQLNLASAGALTKLPDAEVELIPLVKSTPQAMLLSREQIAFGPDPGRLLAGFQAGGEPYLLAARISGPAKSAFPDGPPASAEAEGSTGEAGKTAPHLAEAQNPINVIVVADTDLLQDRFWVQVQNFFGRRIAIPNAANADFTINALDQLGGSPDLISVRSRGTFARPFELVDELEQRAEQRYRAKEQELLNTLRETENKLSELQHQRDDAGTPTLTLEQEREVEKFRMEKVKTRKKLREVRYRLREDIDELEAMLKAFNIVFVPMLISLVGLITWLVGRSRDRGYAP